MSSVQKPPTTTIPPLRNGDHLTRDEFERRYRAMPDVNKAELIEGVVYMPSPVRADQHGHPHVHLATFVGLYEMFTPGTYAADNATVRLDVINEPQPDLLLMIRPECGGQARITDGYVELAPELMVEVSASSVSIDLHKKLDVYRRAEVREYIVWRVEDGEIDWFILRGDQFQHLPAGPDGVRRSETFPGLWLDVPAILNGDGPRAYAVLQQGIASPEHAAFVERLRRA